jgi:hypothetical protein
VSAPGADDRRVVFVVAIGVLIGLGGILVGVCAAWVSRGVWRLGGVVIPWGLLLSAVGSSAGVLLARAVGRGYGFVAAGGWIAGVGALMARNDTVLAGDWLGYAFLLGVTVAVIGSAAWGRGIG